ncbi:MAG: tRNA (adenosine(37)-N6)-threonylcarbamoyltransferase complex ATPase subunit type 1 TsaE [Bacteroidetes bacterium]|nr:tRNA (adenosine(37)-N6)-threonylcarbamoyltransferase complex ATPase subunit type 1 TsaE [Bacteroidota bacterium]
MTFTCPAVSDYEKVARIIQQNFPSHHIFAVNGKMGAGKTTFIKAFCRALGVKDIVQSPTFAIVNEYVTGDPGNIYHLDCYRIERKEEMFEIGYENYFFDGSVCLIEWPEKISELLPEKYVYILITEDEPSGIRKVTVTENK